MKSILELPWVDTFLGQFQAEYRKPPPSYTLHSPTHDDMQYILGAAREQDPFDTAGLKKESVAALQSGHAIATKAVSALGEIIVISFKKDPLHTPWNLWWRCIRLLSSEKRVRILIFAHPKKRELPKQGTRIGSEHVNGGAAYRCNPQSIVIYRKEEVSRVLVHELFHASCSDPYHLDTPYIEADTEAWAEMFLCGMAAKGRPQPFVRHMREQIDWAVRQAATLKDKYKVYSSKEYAWRYLIGRLEVWRRLGIQVPSPSTEYAKVESLRFTICEPKND
jgi:hypothetical protein